MEQHMTANVAAVICIDKLPITLKTRAVQRGARGRHGARDILSWRPTLLCRL
jgi:hypothetical protein